MGRLVVEDHKRLRRRSFRQFKPVLQHTHHSTAALKPPYRKRAMPISTRPLFAGLMSVCVVAILVCTSTTSAPANPYPSRTTD